MVAPPGVAAQDPGGATVLTLEGAVRTALRQNQDLRVARLGLDEAREQVSEAWSNVYPSIDFSANYTRNVSPAVSFLPAIIFNPDASPDDLIQIRFGADNLWNSAVTVEQPLFRPSVFVGVGAAGRFRNLQEEAVRGQSQSVVTQVRLTYYQLLLAQEQRRLTENSVRRVRESLDETRKLNEAGMAADYDVLRLEVELANLLPNVRRADNAVRQARRQLALQLDLKDQDSVRVTGTLASMDLDHPGANTPENREILAFHGFRGRGLEAVGDALKAAAQLRSDLRQFELTEDLRKTQMRLEQVSYLPSVTIFGDYTVTAQENGSPSFFGETSQQRATSKRVGLRVSLPIFQGLRRDARVDQKRAALRQAQVQTRLARERAQVEVKGLVEQADEALARARGQKLAVDQARRGFEIASAQYREGLGSQLELTDAEVALRQSEFNYAQAVYDYLVARARLDAATGEVPLVDVDVRAADGT